MFSLSNFITNLADISTQTADVSGPIQMFAKNSASLQESFLHSQRIVEENLSLNDAPNFANGKFDCPH